MMKFTRKRNLIAKIVLFVVGLMLCTSYAKAAYLKDVPVSVTQPDGTVLNCFATGDEFYNYLHDANGYTIVLNVQTGYYVYADLRDGELVPTAMVPGKSDPSVMLKPYLNISPEKMMEKRRAWEVPEEYRVDEKKTRESNHGTLNNLVIFIRFSDDSEFTNTFSSIDNMFNAMNGTTASMCSYFLEASYNAIYIPTTFYPSPDNENIISYQDILTSSLRHPKIFIE